MSPIPEWIVTAIAAVTVCTVMAGIGMQVTLGDLGSIRTRPRPLLRGLVAVLFVVPVLAVLITRALALPRLAQIGIVLMSISPGAPIALRRSLGAGGHRAFAPTLQICLALLAVVSMPLSIALLNPLYAGHASIAPWIVARQVFVAQLLPIGAGMAVRQLAPDFARRIEPGWNRIGTALVLLLAIVAVIDCSQIAIEAGPSVLAAIALTTLAALAVGHRLGGPDPAMRTAVAISSAARNGGLALLVAAANASAPAIKATVLAYLAVSVFAIVPYVLWRTGRPG